jgi:EmrB/QacA subfamily drug resistance transporter
MNAKPGNTTMAIAGLLLAILMSSMDNTIVATAMGTIVGELGGLDRFVWVTSAYMVAEMAGMPIFGKLSDMYGRKRFFIFGMLLFMAGSALCGTAGSIVELSLYRALQGIGAGALIPIAFTIMMDTIPPADRGKMTGLFGAVFGMSSVFGPLLGAYITDYVSWQWVFYINLPIGMLSFALVVAGYKDSLQHTKQRIDWWGASTLVGAVVCLMFALELGGKKFAWDSAPIVALFGGFAALAVLFIVAESRAEEPIIAFRMFRNRLYAMSNLVAISSGAAFITASVYIPIFIQGVLGGSATNSGYVLLPMMVGTVVTATIGGFLLTRLPYKWVIIPTLALLVAGIGLLSTVTPESTRFMITCYMIMVGLGIGASFSVLSSAVIHPFPRTQHGSANATLNFNRSLGMTLGITIFGILQSHEMTRKLTDAFKGGTLESAEEWAAADPRVLLAPETRALLPAHDLAAITDGLSSSIAFIFTWGLVPAALALIAALAMSREKLDPSIQPQSAPSH